MAKTDQFRIQHKEILALAAEISTLALPIVQTGSEGAIKAKLNTLSGVLSVHLAMEDKSLYPAMASCQNTAAKALAQSFQHQMGGIASAFKSFTGRYPTGRHIADSAGGFSSEFKSILMALKTRIGKEEASLYPLADAL